MIQALKTQDISSIIANRKRFEEVLYTPLREAYAELLRRRDDKSLEREISRFLHGNIPEPLRVKPRAIMFRNLMSPNFEARRFADMVDELKELEPLYWEYRSDKFTSNNELKRALGKLYFFSGRGRSDRPIVHAHNVIDFVASDGKSISSLKTLWGQDFVEFHHEFFDTHHKKLSHTFFDSSQWLGAHGRTAESYYPAFFALFIRHGILFENAMLNKKEIQFTSRVFLPAFLSIYRHFGLKPLIVALTPTDTEESHLWLCYPGSHSPYVVKKKEGMVPSANPR